MMFMDVLPTLAEVAGASVPPNLNGISVLPAMLGREQRVDRMLYWEQYSGGFAQAVRWGIWKGIRTQGTSFALYNLESDPGEQQNIAEQNGDVVRRISEFMDNAHVPSPNWSRQSAAAATAKKKR